MTDEIEEMFSSLARENHENPHALPVKGVTVRLDSELRAEIHALCTITNITRQQLLETLVISGLKTATNAYFSNSPVEAEYEFAQHVSDFLLADGVDPVLAEQLSGIFDFHNKPNGDNQQ